MSASIAFGARQRSTHINQLENQRAARMGSDARKGVAKP